MRFAYEDAAGLGVVGWSDRHSLTTFSLLNTLFFASAPHWCII